MLEQQRKEKNLLFQDLTLCFPFFYEHDMDSTRKYNFPANYSVENASGELPAVEGGVLSFGAEFFSVNFDALIRVEYDHVGNCSGF